MIYASNFDPKSGKSFGTFFLQRRFFVKSELKLLFMRSIWKMASIYESLAAEFSVPDKS